MDGVREFGRGVDWGIGDYTDGWDRGYHEAGSSMINVMFPRFRHHYALTPKHVSSYYVAAVSSFPCCVFSSIRPWILYSWLSTRKLVPN